MYPPAAPIRQQIGGSSGLLIVGACVAGALMFVLMFVILIGLTFSDSQSLGGGGGVKCCGVPSQSIVPVEDVEIGTECDRYS